MHQDYNRMANRYACYLYDAMMLYAQALDETIRDRLRANGTAAEAIFVARDWHYAFKNDRWHSRNAAKSNCRPSGVQGFDMRIDINGDAEGNYTLLALQNDKPHHSDGLYTVLNVSLVNNPFKEAKSKELTRATKLELTRMTKLRHDNVNSFLG
uniref:ANF_receptor domain-containing protein n=1 Tax=Globodera pallida TaxID=36090 RepID=A0A183CFH5_GLOPA